jgi:tetratricopeptide (TPR) repeat protein
MSTPESLYTRPYSPNSSSTSHTGNFEDHVNQYCEQAIDQFKQITRYYAFFHMGFFLLGVVEVLAFLLFFSFFAKSSLLAFALAALFLTAFSYFVLLFYFQAKKPEQLLELGQSYIRRFIGEYAHQDSGPKKHLLAAQVALHLNSYLNDLESYYYKLPKNFESLTPLVEKLSRWSHWKDVHKMKELLILRSIEEYIQLIKVRPCDVDIHALLAKAYVALSRVYMDPRKENTELYRKWVSSEYASPEMQQKFRIASEKAIEEFNIIHSYSPESHWVHAALATLYHYLELPDKEITQFETMLQTNPHDREVLFRLGILYFRQGQNAKGLRIYEQLKELQDEKAEALMSYYE